MTLIEALKSGHVLYKTHNEDDQCREYLFTSEGSYDIRGWGTFYGTINDRLADLIRNPQDWQVIEDYNMNQGYPYPWSVKRR